MQIRIEYRPAPVLTPITPWVHKGVDGPYWKATVFDPPTPRPVHGKGYPVWFIDYRGRSLVFSSPGDRPRDRHPQSQDYSTVARPRPTIAP